MVISAGGLKSGSHEDVLNKELKRLLVQWKGDRMLLALSRVPAFKMVLHTATSVEARLRCASARRIVRLAVIGILLILLMSFCRPLLLLLFPGILPVLLQRQQQQYLSDLLPSVVGTSMAFWVVSFWFLGYIKLPLSVWAWGIIFLAMVLSGIELWKRDRSVLIPLDGAETIALFLLIAAAILRFSLFWRWPLTPAGADMSMHSYLAALIAAEDTVPSSHLPLLPIDSFGAYPIGFQVLTALMSMLGGIPIYRSAMLMEASTLAFLTLAFYGFGRVFWDRPTSAMVALLVTFLARNPQHFIVWGGDPTLLALGLLVLVLAFLPRLEEKMPLGMWCLCALLVASSVLTHLIPIIGLCYAALPVGVYVVVERLRAQREALKRVVLNLLAISMVSGLLVAVCLPTLLSTEVSTEEIEWVKRFQRREAGGAWGGTIGNAIVTIPPYLAEKIFGASFVTLSVLGVVVLAYRRPRLALASGICAVTVVGLVINSMYWLLPLSYAIYPERVALLLLLPAALGIGALVDGVRQLVARRHVLLWGMAVLIVFVAIRNNEKLFREGVIPNTLVSAADLKAIHWIAETTAPGVAVQNRYGDAGLWIPAIAFRPITDPHLNPFIFDEFRAGSAGLKPAYVFVGSKKALGQPIALDEFESKPEMYRKVYNHEGVIIYEVAGHRGKSEGD